MSGGAFDYAQYGIADIYTEIEDEIYGHPLDGEYDVNQYIEDRWLDESEKEYVRKHCHTIPNRSGYSKETIKEFKKGIALLKKAEVSSYVIVVLGLRTLFQYLSLLRF